MTCKLGITFVDKLVYVASVSNRVIARKLEREQKKKIKWKGEGEGRRGNACLQTPQFWKKPLDISRFGSFDYWQLLKIDNEQITRFEKFTLFNKTRSTRLQNWNKKKLYNKRRLTIQLLSNFLFFVLNLNFASYMWLYLIWNLVKTSQRNDLPRTILSTGYGFCRAATLHRAASVEKFSTMHAKFPINKKDLFISKS